MIVKRTQRWRLVAIGMILLIAGGFFWQSYTVFAQTQPVESGRDIVILIDNSESVTRGSDGQTPTDEDNIRVRISKFLVRFLSATNHTNNRVGVITFAGSSNVRVPLTPVNEWQNGDFEAVIGEYEGNTTDFLVALESARTMLAPNGVFNPSHQYEILVLTDGNLNEFDVAKYSPSGYRALIQEQLESLPINVKVRLLTFNDQNTIEWREILQAGDNNYFSLADFSLPEAYALVLEALTGEGGLRDYSSFVVSRTITSSINVPLYREWLRITTFSDNPITPTFYFAGVMIEPIITVPGQEYFFFNPPGGNWDIDIQTATEAVTFLKYETSPSLIEIFPQLSGVQFVDQPINIGANLSVNSEALVPATGQFVITATLINLADPSSQVILQLLPQNNHLYQATKSVGTLPEGEYSVQFEAQGVGDLSDLRAQTTLQEPLQIVAVPSLNIAEFSPLEFGSPITVTITGDAWDTLITPTLTFVIQDGKGDIIELVDLPATSGLVQHVLTDVGPGIYLVSVYIPVENVIGGVRDIRDTQPLSISVPAIEEQATPIPFPTSLIPTPSSGQNSVEQSVRRYWVFLLLFVCIAIILVLLLLNKNRKNEKVLKTAIDELKKELDPPEIKQQLQDNHEKLKGFAHKKQISRAEELLRDTLNLTHWGEEQTQVIQTIAAGLEPFLETMIDEVLQNKLEEQRRLIYSIATDYRSTSHYLALASYLRQRWQKNLDNAVVEMYGLMDNNATAWTLFRYVENSHNALEDDDKRLTDLIRTITSIFAIPDITDRKRTDGSALDVSDMSLAIAQTRDGFRNLTWAQNR